MLDSARDLIDIVISFLLDIFKHKIIEGVNQYTYKSLMFKLIELLIQSVN